MTILGLNTLLKCWCLIKKIDPIRPHIPSMLEILVTSLILMSNITTPQVFHIDGKDMVLGLTNTSDMVLWKYDRYVPHRVLHGHTNWIEALIVARRKPYKVHVEGYLATSLYFIGNLYLIGVW